MEEMLKSWFPNVKLQDQLVVTQTEEAVPSKKLKVRLKALLCKNSSVRRGLPSRTYDAEAVKETEISIII